MTASGHAVGILAESGEDTAEQLRRGNEALYRATLGKTRLAYVRMRRRRSCRPWRRSAGGA